MRSIFLVLAICLAAAGYFGISRLQQNESINAIDTTDSTRPIARQTTNTAGRDVSVAPVLDETPDGSSPFRVNETTANNQFPTKAQTPITPPSAPIVSPPENGYSIQDSIKYYVSKDARRPGNLGGPPPPAFMIRLEPDGTRPVESLLPETPQADKK